jgi:two-component system catabolic regulation response regulator CreB
MAFAQQTILIVEDEPGIADTLQYALRKDGFDPAWCPTAEAALQWLEMRKPSLIVLDVGLPDQNGFDLFRKLRLVNDVPVVFLTARSDEIDRVVGLELGADDYISKPFSPREFLARVRSVLRRAGGNTATHPVAAAAPVPVPAPAASATRPVFDVDHGRRQIRFYGQLLELSRYEYGLLKVLVDRPGHVFTRDMLLSLVWNDHGESLDRTVDAHVKTLRAKLKKVAAGLDPIRTSRGSGYALAENLPPSLPPS